MKIDNEIKKLESQIKIDKDFLWNHPEDGNKEFETSKYITSRLREMGYEVQDKIGTTGVLASVKGNDVGPCILFRSELDALCMDSSGRMKHTCGHDGHMTILLTLAKLVMDNKNNLKGTIKFAFEPAEETTGGAQMLIENGVLENPKVDYVYGVHLWSELKKGTIGIKEGSTMASNDFFDITISGKGGHGALPDKCIDAIYIASQIVTNLQTIVSKRTSPLEPISVNITAINGGTSNNLFPEIVKLKGLCRTYNNNVRTNAKKLIENISSDIAKSLGGNAKTKFSDYSLPPVINDKSASDIAKAAAHNVLAKENLIENYQTMCSDDMALFLEKRPGTFIFVGCTDREYYPQHSENFYVDTESIINGVQILYEIIKKISFKG